MERIGIVYVEPTQLETIGSKLAGLDQAASTSTSARTFFCRHWGKGAHNQ